MQGTAGAYVRAVLAEHLLLIESKTNPLGHSNRAAVPPVHSQYLVQFSGSAKIVWKNFSGIVVYQLPGNKPSEVQVNAGLEVQVADGWLMHALPTQYWFGDVHTWVVKGVGLFAWQIIRVEQSEEHSGPLFVHVEAIPILEEMATLVPIENKFA